MSSEKYLKKNFWDIAFIMYIQDQWQHKDSKTKGDKPLRALPLPFFSLPIPFPSSLPPFSIPTSPFHFYPCPLPSLSTHPIPSNRDMGALLNSLIRSQWSPAAKWFNAFGILILGHFSDRFAHKKKIWVSLGKNWGLHPCSPIDSTATF